MVGGDSEYGYHNTRTRAAHAQNDAIIHKTFEEYTRLREGIREAELAEQRRDKLGGSLTSTSSGAYGSGSSPLSLRDREYVSSSPPEARRVQTRTSSQGLSGLRSRSTYTTSDLKTTSSAYGNFPKTREVYSSLTSAARRSSSDRTKGTATSSASSQKELDKKACVGLSNLGNTCFMNSILQCLFGVKELGEFFSDDVETGQIVRNRENKVAKAFQELVRKVLGSDIGSVVSPSGFHEKVKMKDRKWGGMRQHDSQEFLQFLLNVLREQCNRIAEKKPKYKELDGKGSQEDQAHEALKYYKSWHDSVIDDIFGGLLESSITCDNCNHISYCFDPFLDLSVPVPGSGMNSSSVNLHDCLSKFTEKEKLEDIEGYKCEKCKKQSTACKKLTVYKMPRVVILHLKRFSGGGFSRFSRFSKNSARVSFQMELDFGRYCYSSSEPSRYRLFAISHHSGSLTGGHYYAEVENAYDGCWYNFNDSMVTNCRQPDTSSSTAYVLFYRRI